MQKEKNNILIRLGLSNNLGGLYIQKLEHQLFPTFEIYRTPRNCCLSAKKSIKPLVLEENYYHNTTIQITEVNNAQ